MSSREQARIVMLDTSFFVRLLDDNGILHESAKEYLRFFLENKYQLYVSTVSVAEYCVHGELDQLPFECVRVVPFNLDHAEKAGIYARTLFLAQDRGQFEPDQRLIIPNDTKLFAQASSIGALYFVTSDAKASKAMALLAKENGFSVIHIDIHFPISSYTGTLF